ncbi:MAG: alpha/beta hydrolase [Betaproteobacteria bacterium]|nr:alpha/beta hydrolase [Betaproteobacteria bacterium]
MYQVLHESTSTFVSVRHCRYHFRQWGCTDPSAPLLLLAHGWMDVGASWQFMVDQLDAAWLSQRRVLALDWRGYGQSAWPEVDSYWFPDYLGDLDALIDRLSPESPIDLVGHSMGGNVVMMYAGARPERIHRLVNLEGFGMPETRPAQAPNRLRQWLGELKRHHAGETALHHYPNAEAVARRLMKNNPRLSQPKADWLARHWAEPDAKGNWRILGDAAHKIVNPYLYRVDEMQEVFRQISAPVLAIEASDNSLDQWWKGRYTLEQYHARLQAVPDVRIARIEDAGHMLHHDQPAVLAQLLQGFLSV